MAWDSLLETVDAPAAESAQQVPDGMKRCGRCKQVKPLEEYNKRAADSDKVHTWCRSCCREHRQEYKQRPKVRVTWKKCCKCGERKPADAFHKCSHHRDGLSAQCKVCTTAYFRDLRVRRRGLTVPKQKRCGQCGMTKETKEFHRRPGARDGLQLYCKQCRGVNRRIRWIMQQAAKKAEAGRGFVIESWGQVESAVRVMAELQVEINHETKECDRRIRLIREETVTNLKPLVIRQSLWELAVGDFIRRSRPSCARIVRDFRFGNISYYRQKLDVALDVALAEERIGLP